MQPHTCTQHFFELVASDKYVSLITPLRYTLLCGPLLIKINKMLTKINKQVYDCFFFQWLRCWCKIFMVKEVQITYFLENTFQRFICRLNLLFNFYIEIYVQKVIYINSIMVACIGTVNSFYYTLPKII